MTSPSLPVCYKCKHFIRDDESLYLKCKAFGDDVGGIPSAIIDGENDHKEPYAGDSGIQFEQADDK